MKVKIRVDYGIDLSSIPDEIVSDIHVYIGDSTFRIKEINNRLYITVNNGSMIIYPISSNGIKLDN